MPKKSAASLADLIDEILTKNSRPYMTVTQILTLLKKNESKLESFVEIRKDNIENLVGNRFTFIKKRAKYIVKPCEASDLVLAELSKTSGKSPKQIAVIVPFTKKDCQKVINELVEEGRAKIILNEDLEPRIFLADSKPKTKIEVPKEESNKQYTKEEFKKAFDKLDQGRIFVRICDLRKELKWPREVFDKMLVKLRDNEIIQLRRGDSEVLTSEEIENNFVDENGFRMGLVTWNGR